MKSNLSSRNPGIMATDIKHIKATVKKNNENLSCSPSWFFSISIQVVAINIPKHIYIAILIQYNKGFLTALSMLLLISIHVCTIKFLAVEGGADFVS